MNSSTPENSAPGSELSASSSSMSAGPSSNIPSSNIPSSNRPGASGGGSGSVVQWLNEVKDLQQQVTALNAELIATTENAASWRKRYELEGQQRRSEVTAAQQRITDLELEVAQLRAQPELDPNLGDSAIALQIEGILNMNEVKAKLYEVWLDRDRALEAIKAEQLAHEQTRKDLTMALADAMTVLKPNAS